MSTETLVNDAKRYLESGKAMHLHAIDGPIMETRVRIRQGVTQPQLVCLRTFLASAVKQRKRIVESKAIRTTARLVLPPSPSWPRATAPCPCG